ncbi:MAG: hypothetical protein V3V78_05365 [Candidatus Woesearchaeota archaeon]
MEFKDILKTTSVIGIALSLYFSISGSLNNGWFSCMTLTKVQSCTVLGWILQIIIVSIIFTALLIGITYGALYLIKSIKKQEAPKKEPEKVEEKPKEEKKKIKI